MHSLLSLLVLAVATSCASSGSSPDPGIAPPTERVVAADTHGAYRTTLPPNATAHVPAFPGRMFDASKSVYEELARNIGGTTSDRVSCGTTGRLEEQVRQRLVEKLNASNG